MTARHIRQSGRISLLSGVVWAPQRAQRTTYVPNGFFLFRRSISVLYLTAFLVAAIALARRNLRFRLLTNVLRQGSSHIITLFELPFVVTAHIALVPSRIY